MYISLLTASICASHASPLRTRLGETVCAIQCADQSAPLVSLGAVLPEWWEKLRIWSWKTEVQSQVGTHAVTSGESLTRLQFAPLCPEDKNKAFFAIIIKADGINGKVVCIFLNLNL